MKSIRVQSSRSVGLVVTSLCVAALGQTGCLFGSGSSEQAMRTSASNTSGEGTVRAEAGPNGNTRLEVRVKHLSIPSRVAADASVYVVWVQPHNAAIQNVGALQVDDDLVGKLDTMTPHRGFMVSVTPEPSPRMAAPTHLAVFTSEVNRTD